MMVAQLMLTFQGVPLLASFHPAFQSYFTLATVRTSTRRAPARRKTLAHSLTVAPVV